MLICVLNAINFAFDGEFFEMFAMNTAVFFTDFEIWRILSFPIFTNSFSGLLFFISAFYFISPKLESLFNKKLYPIFLSLIVILIGTITSLFFMDEVIIFGGYDGLSIFLFTLYYSIYFFHKKLLGQELATINRMCIISFGI
jgi:hypothetical protein